MRAAQAVIREGSARLRSHGMLDAAAVGALERWRYEPLFLNGKPTEFVVTVTVSFSLGR